jgi:peptide/histidine transporter 3/4
MTKKGVASRKWNIFNWYFFFMGIASLSALTIVVYIQDNTGWGWGFGIPTIVMFLSIIAFVLGSPFYNTEKPNGSPMEAQWFVWPKYLYQNREVDVGISLEGMLLHTNDYK